MDTAQRLSWGLDSSRSKGLPSTQAVLLEPEEIEKIQEGTERCVYLRTKSLKGRKRVMLRNVI